MYFSIGSSSKNHIFLSILSEHELLQIVIIKIFFNILIFGFEILVRPTKSRN